jgi:hypothetical protein
MLDRQKAFNTAYHGLAAQGFEQSRTAAGCAYRAHDGKRCALGYLIPDSIYHPKFEGLGPCKLPQEFFDYIGAQKSEDSQINVAKWMPTLDEYFLIRLQAVHDSNETPAAMKLALENFAREEGLTIPQLPVTPDAPVSEDAKVERIAINA